MDENLVEAIEKTRKSIKKKYKELQQWRSAEKRSFERIYDPLIKPIKEIGKKEKPIIKNNVGEEKKEEPANLSKNDNSFEEETTNEANETISPQDESENFSDAQELSLREFWLKEMIVSKNYDTTYGPKLINDQLKLGNQDFDIRASDSAIVIGDQYTASTNGLLQLIFYKNPDNAVVTPEDREMYGRILQITSAHRKDGRPEGKILGNPGNKYKNFIQPLLENKGGGNLKFFVSNKKTLYKYWDDPNELLKRLSLLIADKNAGNKTAHDIEIHSILSELHQKKYIKKISRT